MPVFPLRPITSYATVRSWIGAVRRNRAILLPAARIRTRYYLDLGCGPNLSPDFINLDYDWKPGVDVVWDITAGLPFASRSLRGVFTEHCLEHLEFAQTAGVLREIHRILKPGGRVRVVVPDGEIYLLGYAREPDDSAATPALPYAESDRTGGWYTPMLSVNRIFRAHGHKFIYDFATMKCLLDDCGFSSLTKQAFGQGGDPVLLRDTAHRRLESLYVEAVKAA